MAKYECTQIMREFLTELPKCEHHLHLEGTLEPNLLFTLAKKHNIILPDNFPRTESELNETYSKFKDLQEFLDYYYIGCNVLIEENDFFQLAWAYFEKVSKQGLKHAEVFFDPQSHTSRGILMETLIKGFNKACIKAQNELGISTKLVMCLLRHCPVNDCKETIEVARPFIENGMIEGLGLDSSERPFPPGLFKECYLYAKQINSSLRLTAHAGEEGGPEYVTDALNLLNVERIDHGVNSIKDEHLIQRLVQEDIMLTVCPLSNVKLQVVKDVGDLPLQKFLDLGVKFSINSDDPAYFGGYILDNYISLQTRFGWDLKTWCTIAKNSINGSWCDDERKQQLISQVDKTYEKYMLFLN